MATLQQQPASEPSSAYQLRYDTWGAARSPVEVSYHRVRLLGKNNQISPLTKGRMKIMCAQSPRLPCALSALFTETSATLLSWRPCIRPSRPYQHFWDHTCPGTSVDSSSGSPSPLCSPSHDPQWALVTLFLFPALLQHCGLRGNYTRNLEHPFSLGYMDIPANYNHANHFL